MSNLECNIPDPKIDRTLERLVRSIASRKVVLFLGAGISADSPSNLPLSSEMRKHILEKLPGMNRLDRNILFKLLGRRIEGVVYPFEAFMQVLVQNSNFLDFLVRVFSTGCPNKTHHLIAKLMKEGYVLRALTTNFDEKIEQALTDLGRAESKPKLSFTVFWNEGQFSRLDIDNLTTKPTIFKLHGSISDKSSMRITLEIVSGRNLRETRCRILEHFFQNKDCDILILGYSCSDEFDLNPFIRNLGSDNHIYIVEHSTQLSLCNAEIKPLKDPFTNFPGKAIKTNTDELIEYLYIKFFKDDYSDERKEERRVLWPSIIDNWSKNLTEDQKNWISGLMLVQIQEYKRAKGLFQKCLELYKKNGNSYGIASCKKQLALIHESLVNLDRAEILSRESLDFFRSMGSEKDTADLLFQLGRISQARIQPKTAAKLYRKSLEIYNRLGKRFEMAGLYHQLSTVEEDSIEAERLCRKSLGIFDEFGNLPGLAVGFYQLGFVHIMRSELDKAETHTSHAMKIYGLLGNKEGVADSMFQIGTVKLMRGDLTEAETGTKRALKVYREIDKKSGIGAVLSQLRRIQQEREKRATRDA